MWNVTIGQAVVSLGLPSLIMGLFVWWFKRKIEKQEKKAEEHANMQYDFFGLILDSTAASLELCEATARAVQRIPDAHCNGDMSSALRCAEEVKARRDKFFTKQGICAVCSTPAGKG